MSQQELNYNLGFGNHFLTETISGVVPRSQNSPQRVAKGLFTEQLSGSAFTEPRCNTLYSWMYRIRPSVLHGNTFQLSEISKTLGTVNLSEPMPPTQMRWSPLDIPTQPMDFIQSFYTMAANGTALSRQGMAIHHYACNTSMNNSFYYNADAELLIVPEHGDLLFKTESGLLRITQGEIIVIPRGIKFQVILNSDSARGYILENFGAPFMLPELGPIGANGLALPQHFEYPVAAYEERQGDFTLLTQFQGHLWQTPIQYSPLDVVGWHGNYAPYKYDLRKFNTINTVSFDHPDPSIFTVLTSPSAQAGVANCDLVIFSDRWMVAEHTFRPPYFHRNVMSEYMGLIYGAYDAKAEGFAPGGASLHNCMSAHGPDTGTYTRAIEQQLAASKINNTMAFMFESNLCFHASQQALNAPFRQTDYLECWKSLPINFGV